MKHLFISLLGVVLMVSAAEAQSRQSMRSSSRSTPTHHRHHLQRFGHHRFSHHAPLPRHHVAPRQSLRHHGAHHGTFGHFKHSSLKFSRGVHPGFGKYGFIKRPIFVRPHVFHYPRYRYSQPIYVYPGYAYESAVGPGVYSPYIIEGYGPEAAANRRGVQFYEFRGDEQRDESSDAPGTQPTTSPATQPIDPPGR